MGAGRPLKPFHCSQFQGLACGPKNSLGLKEGLKYPDMVWVAIDEPHGWWTYPADSTRVQMSMTGPLPDQRALESFIDVPQGQVEFTPEPHGSPY